MTDDTDTGNIWLTTLDVQRLYGVAERTARDWATRHACAVTIPRDCGGVEHRYWRPALDAALLHDTGLADDERREMRAFAPRLFEP